METGLVHYLIDVALAVLIAPVVIWLLWDLLHALGGSPGRRPASSRRVDAVPVPPPAKIAP